MKIEKYKMQIAGESPSCDRRGRVVTKRRGRIQSLALAIGLSTVPTWTAAAGTSPPPDSAHAKAAMSGERLALYAKPSVVSVIDGYVGAFKYAGNDKTYSAALGMGGTGFFVSSDGFILTNAHVVDITHSEYDRVKGVLEEQYLEKLKPDLTFMDSLDTDEELLSHTTEQITPVQKVVFYDGTDLDFEIIQCGHPMSPQTSDDVAVLKVSVTDAPVLKLGDSQAVADQDHVSVIGFPETQESPFIKDTSNYEPSITDGKVSARRTANDGLPLLQVSAEATHGNSGGPVLNDYGEVIGLLTFGGGTSAEQQSAGFAFAVPTSTAMQYVNEAHVANQPADLDTEYEQGLDYFFDQHYSAAVEKFRAVQRMFPHHSKAPWLIEQCQSKITAGADVPLPSPTPVAPVEADKSVTPLLVAGIGGAGLFVLLVIVGVAVAVRSGRGKSKAGPPPAPVPLQRRQVLRGVSGYYAGNQLVMGDAPLFIGRDPSCCQLVFPADAGTISGRHCMLRRDPGSGLLLLEDCESTNGTFLLSGERLEPHRPRALAPNDRFYLSGPETMFEIALEPR